MGNAAPFKHGDYVEDSDDGMVQKVRIWTENGRLQTGGFEGLAVPIGMVREYLLLIKKRGLDEDSVRRCH